MHSLKNISVLMLLAFSLLITTTDAQADTTKYFGNIRYNHVSPHVEIKGVNPLNKEQIANRPHFIFTYGSNKKLFTIVDKSYNVVKRHHIASLGAYKVTFTYENNKETRHFFDVNNEPMLNMKGVYKEVYSFNDNGFKNELSFYDLQGKIMESNWKISNYQWFKKGNWVVEQRFNLKNEKQPLAPYFDFATTAIEYDTLGNPYKHFNLNEKLEVTNNAVGVAYYQDTYDEKGLHKKYAYYDQNNHMTHNQWKFGYAVKHYDELGNYLYRIKFDKESKQLSPSYKKTIPQPTSTKDIAEIKRIATGYLIALQQRKPDLMKEVLHEKLAKHTISNYAEGGQYIRETTYDSLLKFAQSWNSDGTRFPPVPKNQVTILDSYKNMATVKLVSDNWYEYLHLIKMDGQWKIKNLVWTRH
ncbi:MAG: nuclear transport factor 2 family protein [Colwellia sp.]|nr:nuclear transport factor 2 family protein [Colwellia sp.]